MEPILNVGEADKDLGNKLYKMSGGDRCCEDKQSRTKRG